MSEIEAFDTEEAARAWMLAQVNEPDVDNVRFAFDDDAEAKARYTQAVEAGCCGAWDEAVVVAGRPAMIGCNYGH